MGNAAIARGALEAGVQYVAGYPGTPSSEIVQFLAAADPSSELHVEWSVNEKVATEGAAAAALAGLRSLATMKNAGLSVALDFLTHLSYTGIGDRRGAMVVVVCDDPSAHSSGDETDSRWLARFSSAPLLEPASVQEALDMTKWAFELSEEFGCFVFVRGYTRLCHASSMVAVGEAAAPGRTARIDPSVTISPYLAKPKHAAVLEKLQEVQERFEHSTANRYQGPKKPDLLVVCGGSGLSCSEEAIQALDLGEKVGILNLATLWPFPRKLVDEYMRKTDQVLVAEEVDPYIETHLKELLVDEGLAATRILGKASGHIPEHGEITPDRVMAALGRIYDIQRTPLDPAYEARLEASTDELLISRGVTWCAGCPHRASFWALQKAVKADGRGVYVTGDIGCYTLDVFPGGTGQINVLHAMGSGTGMASGFGQLAPLGFEQPVIALCGDSTFFHGSIPALINAVYNGSHMILIILDNAATAMTGFQSHPGTGFNAQGNPAPQLDIEDVCRSLGCEVALSDPFDVRATLKAMRRFLKREQGVQVLILRRTCEIVRMKQEKTKPYVLRILDEQCKGEECLICTSAFRCPALFQDPQSGKAQVREDLCSGCGVCTQICPFHAMAKEETG